MSDHTIIDRRKTPKNKSLENKQRFLKRAKELLKKSISDNLSDRSITSEDGQEVKIPRKGINEPTFQNDPYSGSGDMVLPGNKSYKKGDLLEKPKGGSGSGGSEGSDSGEDQDTFRFFLSKEEYFSILFDGLELPNFIKKTNTGLQSYKTQRSGFSNNGSPSNLDVVHTMKNSIGRRLALRKPKDRRIQDIAEELLKETDQEQIRILTEELDTLKRKLKTVPYIDPVDLRFRNFEKIPNPMSKAVMFCIMDVSASMGQKEKDLAKRFYILLYTFLRRKYEKVDIIFIRHHTTAKECTEEEFFYSQESGGTVVSSGFELMMKIQKERYSENEYNLYCAQCSDGDNFSSDNHRLRDILENQVLPAFQYFCYIEILRDESRQYQLTYGVYVTTMWGVYDKLSDSHRNMRIAQVTDESDIYPVFKELFKKESV